MIEIRRLEAQEKQQLAKMHSVVYNFRRDFSKDDEYKYDPLDDPPHWSWGVFEKGKLVSGMDEHEYLMRFDGHSVPMSGIGGVGTLPEARRGGLVRSLFQRFYEEAREKGVVFSTLSPFSYPFYRNLGYEVACSRILLTIPSELFLKQKLQGSFTQIFPGDDTAPLNEVHRQYIDDLNHGIHRDHWADNRAWKQFTRNDPYAKGIFLFLWRDDEGRARGYIKYEDIHKGDDNILSVRELAFTDREALYGVLSLVGGLCAQFEQFQWLMPDFLDPMDFLNADRELEQQIQPRDMSRILHVQRALELMRRPPGEGEYVIEVEDELVPANRGRYLVEYGPGSGGAAGTGESRVSLTQRDADLRCDIGVLSQLVTGYRTLEKALRTRRTGLELYSNRETLERVFTLRPQHLTEYF